MPASWSTTCIPCILCSGLQPTSRLPGRQCSDFDKAETSVLAVTHMVSSPALSPTPRAPWAQNLEAFAVARAQMATLHIWEVVPRTTDTAVFTEILTMTCESRLQTNRRASPEHGDSLVHCGLHSRHHDLGRQIGPQRLAYISRRTGAWYEDQKPEWGRNAAVIARMA